MNFIDIKGLPSDITIDQLNEYEGQYLELLKIHERGINLNAEARAGFTSISTPSANFAEDLIEEIKREETKDGKNA